MMVQILLEDTMRTIVDGINGLHRFAFEYEDTTSATPINALTRAWRMTNGAIMRLNEEDLELRLRWEELHGGVTISVGDIVIVDNKPYECLPDGWTLTSIRNSI